MLSEITYPMIPIGIELVRKHVGVNSAGNLLLGDPILDVSNSEHFGVFSALTVRVLKSNLFSLGISFKPLCWYSIERLVRTSDCDTIGAMKRLTASELATLFLSSSNIFPTSTTLEPSTVAR